MKIAKLHGLGNDFLIVPAEEAGGSDASYPALVRRICHRHTGIGADGVIFYRPTLGDTEADISALIYNADGSRAEMSGNGTRCLAAFLVHTGVFSGNPLHIRTVAGIRTFLLREREGHVYRFRSSLGQPITEPAKIPVLLGAVQIPVVGFPLRVGAEVVPVTLSSMGNPHCSTFWPDVNRAPLESLGKRLEYHESFPNRTNVEFIQVIDRHHIRVRFWERGVGVTLSSGTGSAAAAVASILQGYAQSPVTVDVEMGSLLVAWDPPGELYLTGPAEFIFSTDLPNSALP
jgi:diaminopimelate epimerase